MSNRVQSIRPFIGAKNFDRSREFYRDLGFEETLIHTNLAVFKMGHLAFYLQNAYVKDWVDNTMVFMEVGDIERFYQELLQLNLGSKYEEVRLEPIRHDTWGKECFLHDPSGILWHFGSFTLTS